MQYLKSLKLNVLDSTEAHASAPNCLAKNSHKAPEDVFAARASEERNTFPGHEVSYVVWEARPHSSAKEGGSGQVCEMEF